MTAVVLVEDRDVAGGTVRTVRLDRPDSRNAMDSMLLAELAEVLADAASASQLRGLLITGGPEVFSAGADLREETGDDGARRMELFGVVYESLSLHPLPTVAAVEGPAVGGGAEVAAACDVRIAGRSARFRFPGASFGIPVGAARTIGLVGLGTAKDWVLSCRDVSAEEALLAGFVQRVVHDGTAEAEAFAWLELVATRDAPTVGRLKRVLNDFAGLADRVAWENDALRGGTEAPARPGAFGMPARAQRS